MTAIKFDCNIVVGGDWGKKFSSASPSERAIMLAALMEDYNNGEVGVDLSFSEPVIHEHED